MVNNNVTVLLQILSGICMPEIIKMESDLTKLLRRRRIFISPIAKTITIQT